MYCIVLIVDIWFLSGDIRDRSAKSSEIAPKKMFSAPIFFGEHPQILDPVFKIAPISDHVAKFRGDRLRERGDLALNKKKKKNSSKTRLCVITQRADLKMLISVFLCADSFPKQITMLLLLPESKIAWCLLFIHETSVIVWVYNMNTYLKYNKHVRQKKSYTCIL